MTQKTEDDWASQYRDLLTENNDLRHEVSRLREDMAAIRRVCEHPADAARRVLTLLDS